MERRSMIPLEDQHLKQKSIETSFLTSDYISHADIISYVEEIMAHIRAIKKIDASGQPTLSKTSEEKEDYFFILDALRESTIYKAILKKIPQEVVSKVLPKEQKELEYALKPIRQAIITELGKYLDDSEYALLREQLNQKTEKDEMPLVSQIEGARGKKTVLRDLTPLRNRELRQETIKACRALQKATEQNRHVVGIMAFDTVTGNMTVEHRSFQTLWSLTQDLKEMQGATNREKIQKSKKLLRIVNECLEGASYFHSLGVVLQDIKPANLGLTTKNDKDPDIGLLFDIDGLVTEGSASKNRISTEGYTPPENISRKDIPVSTKEMSYQFGKIIEELLKTYNFSLPITDREKIDALKDGLTAEDPRDRFSVTEAHNILTSILRPDQHPLQKRAA